MNAIVSIPSNAAVSTVQSAKVVPGKDSPHSFRAAYEATAPQRNALAPSDLQPVNLDVQVVTTTVLGTLPRMVSLREDIVTALPSFDVAQFDNVELYAKALAFAQTVYGASWTPTESLPDLATRGIAIRQQFVTDATALAWRGLIDGARLEELKGGSGYLNVAADLGVLVRMFRERWTEIGTKTAIQPAELDEAEHLFERIMLAYAERTRHSEATTAAAGDRQRAYTLLVNAYDQARRAVTYLRWEENDVEKFTPSLWAGRGRRRSGSSEPAKGTEGPANTNGVAPAAPVLAAPTAPGLPGGSPFVIKD